jgi:steroid delta-isomerase-like uncharacterized protein
MEAFMYESERLVHRFFTEAINGHDLDLFDELCSPDYVWHGGSDPGAIGDVHGIVRFKEAVATFFTAFPDLEATILDTVATEDKVCVRFVERGTHRGTFVGVEATGRPVEFHGMGIYRVEDGRLTEEWFVDDSRAIFEQIGAIPILRETGV